MAFEKITDEFEFRVVQHDAEDITKDLLGAFRAVNDGKLDTMLTVEEARQYLDVLAAGDYEDEEIEDIFNDVKAGHTGSIRVADFVEWIMADYAVDKLNEPDFEGVAGSSELAVASWRKLRPELAQIYEAYDDAGTVFVCGLRKKHYADGFTTVLPRITSAQAEAMWDGYVSGTGRTGFAFEDFCVAVEAVEISDLVSIEAGNHAAAEFAGISCEAFELLGAKRIASKEVGESF